MKNYQLFNIIVALIGTTVTVNAVADVKFSGFGSLVAGKTLGSATLDDPLNFPELYTREQTFTADFYDVGQYTNDLTFKAESVFAIQAVADLGEKLKITGQLVAKGTDNFKPEFDWYYMTYQATDNLTILAGRRNIPMYYFSEFSEVGYAYPWMRPPANLYWWQVTQFNGFTAMYDFTIADYSNTLTLFHGNEYSYDNKEMNFYDKLYGGNALKVDELWTDITGLNWNISGDIFDFRFVYFQHDLARNRYYADSANNVSIAPVTQKFLGFGGTINVSSFTFLFDWNSVTRNDAVGTEFPTYLLSVVYNIDEFQPYISYSKADHKQVNIAENTENYEEHYLMSYGLRYNFHSSASLKFQYDQFVDQGMEHSGWKYHGDSKAITMGIDFIF